ncbi:MAG TPA: aminopeptidase [Rectinemataceae bacterium]|nr:aminopeptidase [Rectinemataceae bacterium]
MRATTILALAALPLLLSSCYVTSEGLHYLGLLSKGRPIAEVIADPSTPEATKTLLRNAEAIQAFGVSTLGEKATRNYRRIVEIQGTTLVHVVQACASLSFDRWLWNYPFVGKLPYRGYFELKDAEKEAAALRAKGLDVIVRDADAFSTLGWLSDPLWSFMADYSEADIADLILHESMHATAFRTGGGQAGSDDWNEGIATFVGRQGSLLWLESRYGKDSKEVAEALAERKDAETFAAFLRETAKELETVYSSPVTDDEKRMEKAAIIAARAKLYATDYSSLFVTDRYKGAAMARINNAWLDLYRLYEGEPALYRDWYEKVDKGDLRAFVADMKGLAKAKAPPLLAMRQRLEALR